MNDIQVLLKIPASDAPFYLAGIVEMYPNETTGKSSQIPDDMWALTLPKKILTEIVNEGLKRIAIKTALEAPLQTINATITVILPDGTVLEGT